MAGDEPQASGKECFVLWAGIGLQRFSDDELPLDVGNSNLAILAGVLVSIEISEQARFLCSRSTTVLKMQEYAVKRQARLCCRPRRFATFVDKASERLDYRSCVRLVVTSTSS